jgi:hypothetical protein
MLTPIEPVQTLTIEEIAQVCHEANRALQAIQARHEQEAGARATRAPIEPTIAVSPPWGELDQETRVSVVSGVEGIVRFNYTPEQSHASWMRFKGSLGWTYGPVKDEAAKTHPCMVPYHQLPPAQRLKDALFGAIVRACSQTDPTVVERLMALQADLEARRDAAGDAERAGTAKQPGAGRALSLAITHLEDARARFTEALARQLGKFNPADLERNTPEAERAAFYGRGT